MKVVVSAGGTGGHIYPALAILEKLKNKAAFERVEKVAFDTFSSFCKGPYARLWPALAP